MITSCSMLAVAQDPGGAEALTPVLKGLFAKNHIRLSVLARQHACKIFTKEGFKFINSDMFGVSSEGDWRAFAETWLKKYKPKLILTATSLNSGLEKSFIRAARGQRIPCITILDSWTNYRARFLDHGEKHLFIEILPNIITVMDDFAADEMCRAGFPKAILNVVGQPALEHFLKWVKSDLAEDERLRTRKSLDIPNATMLIVFFSQPIAETYGPPGSTYYRGYDEFDVLGLLLSSLSKMDMQFNLVIKTHPKEPIEKFKHLLADTFVSTRVVNDYDSDQLIIAADLIVGMTSIAMVKGLLAGRQVLSLQPNLIGEDSLVLGRMGILKPVTDPKLFPDILHDMLSYQNRQLHHLSLPVFWTDGQSTERILAIIEKLMASEV